jgi:hypothetical protein
MSDEPNFNELLRKPVDEAKRPPALPGGTYFGTITKQEYDKANNDKKTPFCRYHVTLESAHESIPAEDLEGTDLTKKTMRREFYLTPEADWRLAEFLKSCGIDTSGRSFAETIPEALGKRVQVEVTRELNKKKPTDPPYNNISDMTGVPA